MADFKSTNIISKGTKYTHFVNNILTLLIAGLLMLTSCSKKKDDKDKSLAITSVTPLEGPKNTTVTIRGSHFGYDMVNLGVYFNNSRATILTITDEKIECTVPVKAGSGIIKIVTPDNKTINGPQFTYKLTPILSTVAGSINGYADGTGFDAKFGQSSGLCTDETGNIFMVDYFNSKIRKVTPQGVVTTIAGGALGYADGAGSAAMFAGPVGITYAGNGNFYITDTYNYLIRKMTSGAVISTIAGKAMVSGTTDGNGALARFYNPLNVCVDAANNLYVTDAANYRIRKIDPSGNVTTLAGSTQGYEDGPVATAKFNQPDGICIDAQGNLYVSDYADQKIRKITPAGMVSTLAGSTAGAVDGVGTAAKFKGPAGICLDKDGNILVADAENNRIRKVTPSGVVTTVVGEVNGDFAYPTGVCVDPTGIIYIMDTYAYRIRKLIFE